MRSVLCEHGAEGIIWARMPARAPALRRSLPCLVAVRARRQRTVAVGSNSALYCEHDYRCAQPRPAVSRTRASVNPRRTVYAMPACAGGGGAARDHGCRLARVGEPRASRHCDGVRRADADRFQQAAGSRSHSSLFDCARGRWARSLRVRERWNSESCGWSAGAQCQCKLSTPRAGVWQGATKLEETPKCAGALEARTHATSAFAVQ